MECSWSLLFNDIRKWFAELDRFRTKPFMKKGDRKQPATPRREIFD